jgi:pimeloyl-ACP methyl ester carboxylesterase
VIGPSGCPHCAEPLLNDLRAVGSPGYPSDENEIAARAGRAYGRCYDPAGVARQAIATVASGDRTDQLQRLNVPTLVIHGLADRMCDVSGGRAAAEAIPGAELFLIEGMGHDLPPALQPQLTAHITQFMWRVEAADARCPPFLPLTRREVTDISPLLPRANIV